MVDRDGNEIPPGATVVKPPLPVTGIARFFIMTANMVCVHWDGAETTRHEKPSDLVVVATPDIDPDWGVRQ